MSLEPRRVLLLQPRFLGDVLLCTPAIRAVRRRYPDAELDFVTETAGAEVLSGNPHLRRVLVREPGLRGRLRLLREVVRGRYDAAVDFRATGSTAHLVAASGAAVRVGIRTKGPTNFAYTHLFPLITLGEYAARYKLRMLGPIGVSMTEATDLRLELPIGPEAVSAASRWWDERGLEGESVVAISPISREPFKDWGSERWDRVGTWLQSNGHVVLVSFGPGEESAAREFAARLAGGRVHLFGGRKLEEFAAVLSRCRAWTGNDGGARHVAVAVGVPTLAVSRWRIGPVWTHPAGPVLHRTIDQAPPGGCDMRCPSCAHRACLAAIRTGEVVERLTTLLDSNEGEAAAGAATERPLNITLTGAQR